MRRRWTPHGGANPTRKGPMGTCSSSSSSSSSSGSCCCRLIGATHLVLVCALTLISAYPPSSFLPGCCCCCCCCCCFILRAPSFICFCWAHTKFLCAPALIGRRWLPNGRGPEMDTLSSILYCFFFSSFSRVGCLSLSFFI